MSSLLDVLFNLNPWWLDRPYKSGIKRERYLEIIRRYLKAGEILVLNGVRRSGKNFLKP